MTGKGKQERRTAVGHARVAAAGARTATARAGTAGVPACATGDLVAPSGKAGV